MYQTCTGQSTRLPDVDQRIGVEASVGRRPVHNRGPDVDWLCRFVVFGATQRALDVTEMP